MSAWDQLWKIDTSLRPRLGGQGSVYRVINRVSGERGALKRLLNPDQSSYERRARFQREVLAMQDLKVPTVPKLIESNVSTNDSNELYAVFEWIDGTPLHEFVNGIPQPLNLAIGISASLAATVRDCHGQGFIHRDIKPSNIILSPDGIPYLVDFGMAWSEDHLNELTLTAQSQEIGNRFLRLPELTAGGVQRDHRSDVAFLVGIFFFLLAGASPRALFDDAGRPPHRSLANRFPESLKLSEAWRRISSIFDVGFQVPLDLRFQNATAFAQMLTEIGAQRPNDDLGAALELAVHEHQNTRRRIDEAVDRIEDSLSQALSEFKQAMAPLANFHGFHPIQGKPEIVKTGREAKLLWGLSRKDAELPRVFVEILVSLEGETRSYVAARMRTAKFEKPGLTLELYRGPSADITRLKEEMIRKAPLVLAEGIGILTRKIQGGG